MALKKSSKTKSKATGKVHKSPFREGMPESKKKKSAKAKPVKEPKKEDQLSFSILKSKAGKIVTSVEEYGDSMHLNIRHFYKSKDGEWLPTKKGTTIPLHMGSKFARRLGKLLKRAEAEGHEISEDEDA